MLQGLKRGGKVLRVAAGSQAGATMRKGKVLGAARMAALLVLALTACNRPAPKVTGFRNPGQAIASAALFDAGRFAGEWHVVAAYSPEAACGPLVENWRPATTGGQFRVEGTTCTAAGLRGMHRTAEVSGPGRITRQGPNGVEVIWVLWVDADYRVAVLGTPSGQFGRIIARSTPVRPDLLRAAQEIMEFNGYDISRLKLLN